MMFAIILDPSSLSGTLIIGIFTSLIAGFIGGFFTGKHYERNNIIKLHDNTGNIFQDSIISGGNDEKIKH